MKLKKIESIEELKVGDVLVIQYTNVERTILEKLTNSVLLSQLDDRYSAGNWYAINDIKESPFQLKVKEKPWEPDFNDEYWAIDFNFDEEKIVFLTRRNFGSVHDNRLKLGLVFRTQQEAEEAAKKMLEAIKK